MDWLDSWRGSWTSNSASDLLEDAAMLDEANGADVNPTASTSRLSSAAIDCTHFSFPTGKKRQRNTEVESSEPRSTGRVRKPPAALAGYQFDGSSRVQIEWHQFGQPGETPRPGQFPKRQRVRRSAESDAQASSAHASPSLRYSTRARAPELSNGSFVESGIREQQALQVSEATQKEEQPEPPRMRAGRVMWSASETVRLRTAILAHAGLDPVTSSLGNVKITREADWLEVKRIFDLLAPRFATSVQNRPMGSLRSFFHRAMSHEQQPGAVVAVPAGTVWPPSTSPCLLASQLPTPSSSAAGTASLPDFGGVDANNEEALPPSGGLLDSSAEDEDRAEKEREAELQVERRQKAAQQQHEQRVALPTANASSATSPQPGCDIAPDERARGNHLRACTQSESGGPVRPDQSTLSVRVEARQAQDLTSTVTPELIAQDASGPVPAPSSVVGTSTADSVSNAPLGDSQGHPITFTAPTPSDTATVPATSTAQEPSSPSAAAPASIAANLPGQQTAASMFGKRFTPEEDQQMIELKRLGYTWSLIGMRLGRTGPSCAGRYTLLREKAKLAGQELPGPPARKRVAPPVAAINAVPALSALPLKAPTVTTGPPPHAVPLPPYTPEDDIVILRMYLRGDSAERIGVAIKRSALSVHRRWSKKRSEWIAAGLLTTGDKLRLRDEPSEQPAALMIAASSVTAPRGDVVAGGSALVAATPAPNELAVGDPVVPIDRPPVPGTTEHNLGGNCDAPAFLNDDLPIDPALLGLRLDVSRHTETSETNAPNRMQTQMTGFDGSQSRQGMSQFVAPSEYDTLSGAEATATPAQMLAEAMPHYDSGMKGLHRFLQLVKAGAEEKKR